MKEQANRMISSLTLALNKDLNNDVLVKTKAISSYLPCPVSVNIQNDGTYQIDYMHSSLIVCKTPTQCNELSMKKFWTWPDRLIAKWITDVTKTK